MRRALLFVLLAGGFAQASAVLFDATDATSEVTARRVGLDVAAPEIDLRRVAVFDDGATVRAVFEVRDLAYETVPGGVPVFAFTWGADVEAIFLLEASRDRPPVAICERGDGFVFGAAVVDAARNAAEITCPAGVVAGLAPDTASSLLHDDGVDGLVDFRDALDGGDAEAHADVFGVLGARP